jgi:transcriptional regulator with XRE-family HTH domain
MDMDTPADRLRRARVRKGVTAAAEAARQLGMPPATYQNYEDGSRGFARHLIRLARFYGVRPQWLMTGQGLMKASDLEERFNMLTPDDQAKVIEYIDLLSRKRAL